RQQIELRKIVGTVWKPWSNSVFKDHADIVHARELSMKRVTFYNPESDTSILYLGERFLRKTRGFITIPRSPRERLEDIANPSDPIDVVEGRDYIHVQETKYVWWWRRQSIGFFLPEIQRQDNRDEVGVASTQDPTFIMNKVPTIHPSRYAYDNVSQASPEFRTMAWYTERSDSHGNHEQWKDLAYKMAMLNVTKDKYWFELDRAHALGELNYGGERSTSTSHDFGESSQYLSRKIPATSHDAAVDDTQNDYVPQSQDEVVPQSQLTQMINNGGVQNGR
ncbi:hypothetical protein C5167_044272, partial [Papaver somniferum]